MVLKNVLISFFTSNCLVFPAPFIEETVFAPLYILASFVKNKVAIGAWVSFWAFCLVALVYVSVFVPAPYCLVGFLQHSLKSGRLMPPALFLFLKMALAIRGSFMFPYEV